MQVLVAMKMGFPQLVAPISEMYRMVCSGFMKSRCGDPFSIHRHSMARRPPNQQHPEKMGTTQYDNPNIVEMVMAQVFRVFVVKCRGCQGSGVELLDMAYKCTTRTLLLPDFRAGLLAMQDSEQLQRKNNITIITVDKNAKQVLLRLRWHMTS